MVGVVGTLGWLAGLEGLVAGSTVMRCYGLACRSGVASACVCTVLDLLPALVLKL